MDHYLTLVVLDEILAVCRLQPGTPLPTNAFSGALSAVIHSPEEVTLVCQTKYAPQGAVAEQGWRALRVKGPLDFSMTGVLVSLALPLSRQGVSIFAISSYETDYLLVKEDMLAVAVEALRRAGHTVEFATS
jgi:hypothetical protein